MRLSAAQVRALDKFCQAGGHGYGEYAYLSRATAIALSERGLVVLSIRDLGGGRKMRWGFITDAGRDALRETRNKT